MSVAYQLLNACIENNDVLLLTDNSIRPEFFRGGELEIYELIRIHYGKYGSIPKWETLREKIDESSLDRCVAAKAIEPARFYVDRVFNRFVFDSLKMLNARLVEELRKDTAKDNPKDVLSTAMQLLAEISVSSSQGSILDFRNSAHDLRKTYLEKINPQIQNEILLGWPSIDQGGGLSRGDVGTIVGRPSRGKTWLMLFMAHHLWKQQKKTPLLISMEMNTISILQRLAAIDSSIDSKAIKNGLLTSSSFEDLTTRMTALGEVENPFWICEGLAATTVEELVLIVQQLKPDCVYIDGAYLMRTNTRANDRFARVAESINSIKWKIATELNVPVVCSYQFNREHSRQTKKADFDSSKVGLENIGYADEIGQLSSIVLGVIEDETIEQLKQKKISVLKGRYGEQGDFSINWDFTTSNFSEVLTDDSDIQFID